MGTAGLEPASAYAPSLIRTGLRKEKFQPNLNFYGSAGNRTPSSKFWRLLPSHLAPLPRLEMPAPR